MRYATPERVALGIPAQTLIWLTNDDPEATTVNTAVLEEVAANEEDFVDDHLRGRYVLPLASVPTTVANLAVTLIRHALYARRPETEVPKDVVRMYDGAVGTLRAIRDGRLTLGIEASQAAQPEPGSVRVRAPGRMFGDDVLSGY